MSNKSILIIYLFLFLSANIYYAYSWPGKLPEIDFKPYDKRPDNLLNIELLHHDITLETDTFFITSTWTIHFDNETADFGELIVKSNRSDAGLSYVSLNNTEIKPIPIENKKNHYLLQLPTNIDQDFDAKITLKYKIQEKSGFKLAFFTAQDLFHIARIVKDKNNEPGYDLRERTNMDFSEVIKTSAHFNGPSNYIVFGSNRNLGEFLNAGMYMIGFADSSYYGKVESNIMQTDFQIIYSKITGLLEPKMVIKIITKSWPLFLKQFPKPTDCVVLFENPHSILGAGPYGTNVLGFNIMESIPEKTGEVLAFLFNIPKCSSTKEFVENFYIKYKNPWIEYMTNLIIHELGHLFFGFGITVERHPYSHDYWFSLALGMIYDREINKQLTGNYPHIIEYMVDTWKSNYKNRTDIDQKLIQPDLSNDKQAGMNSFHRTQYFAHGKGFYVLNQIREVIGPRTFDQEVVKYLEYGLKNNDGYISFRKQLLERFEELPKLEAQLEVF
jgi:hypothetical protein